MKLAKWLMILRRFKVTSAARKSLAWSKVITDYGNYINNSENQQKYFKAFFNVWMILNWKYMDGTECHLERSLMLIFYNVRRAKNCSAKQRRRSSSILEVRCSCFRQIKFDLTSRNMARILSSKKAYTKDQILASGKADSYSKSVKQSLLCKTLP